MSIAANRKSRIRCVVCSEPYSAMMSRLHNDANVLALGARVVGNELALMICHTFLETGYEAERHVRRVEMLSPTVPVIDRAEGEH
jgi:ribose 5-phosphate isomerase B